MSRKNKRANLNNYCKPVRPQVEPNLQGYWPFASPQQPNVVVALPNSNDYTSYGVGTVIGLPKYQSIDEYGRIFSPPLTYGAQPCSAPVPVPKPASMVQTAPVTMPIRLVDADNNPQ